jgi:hypothetical protein
MNQWGNQEGQQVIWQWKPIHGISSICFHLNRLESGKDDSSSEAHLPSSKTSRGSYLDQELFIFLKYLNSILWPSLFKGSVQQEIKKLGMG